MSRDTARKIARDPAGDHVLARRNNSGTVQVDQTGAQSTGVDPGTTGSGTVTVGTTTVTSPNIVLFTSGSLSANGGAAGTTVNLIRDGTTTLASTSGAGSTTYTVNTHATPLNAPTYAIQVQAAGSTPTAVTATVSREDRWA